ncbi:MAG: RidA family protein [Gemmatimonadota bacterium]|jgi:reactive intermediate/imine deaminase
MSARTSIRWAALTLAACTGLGACSAPSAAPTARESVTPAAMAAPEFGTSELTAGLGLPFSEFARVGDLIFLSGMIGTKPGTLELVDGGFEAESRQALENIDLMLRAAGASRTDVLKCTAMLDDMSLWPRFNQIYGEFFGNHRPVRSAFGTDGLAIGAAVEIECIAAAPPR